MHNSGWALKHNWHACGRAAAAAKCFLVSYWPLGPGGGGRVPCPEGLYIATSYALSEDGGDGGGVSKARSAARARALFRRKASSFASIASDAARAAASSARAAAASARAAAALSRSRTDSSRVWSAAKA